MTTSMILYDELSGLPKFDENGNVISPVGAGIIGSASALIGNFIKEGSFGNNKIVNLVFASGAVISQIVTLSYRIAYDENGFISGIDVLNGEKVLGAIAGDALKGIIDVGAEASLTGLLTAAAATLGFASAAGSLVGVVTIAGIVSTGYPYLKGLTEDVLKALDGTSSVDMQFTDKDGTHDSGLFFKDGMNGKTDKEAITYFLDNNGEDTDGGVFTFSISGGSDHSYNIYNASNYQTIAEQLGITLEQFLAAGYNGTTNADGFIGEAAYSAIFKTTSPVLIYIPVKINGVTQSILVNGIYTGSLQNNNLVMGRSAEAALGNALIINSDSNAPLIIQKYNSNPFSDYDYIKIGTNGSNTITAEDGNDTIISLNGDDTINAGYGSNIIDGGEGSDTIDYSFASFGSRDLNINLITNRATNGLFSINQVNDAIYNIENIIASTGSDTITGNDSINTLIGNDGNDTISGGRNNDFLYGNSGSDSLSGDEGNDFLSGGGDNDSLSGGADNDTLLGNDGNDTLNGGTGNDNLQGETGNDNLQGETGNDNLQGETGNDTYIFNNTYNKDTITDSDHNGKIIINNQTITGTATLINAENPGIYQLVIGVNVYSLTVSGSDLVIVNQGDPENENTIQNQVTIKDFNSGDLGITLSDVPDEGNGETPKINHVYLGTDGTSFSINGNSLVYGNINNSNKNQKNFSNQNFQNLQKQKRSNKFVNLMICFLVIMFSISIPKTSYSMSFFASELEKKYKPLSLPTSVPFDITKKGNEVEAYIEVEKWAGYSFMLEFRYYDPRDDKNSKYYRNSLERAISEISMFKKYSRKYSKEELAEIFIDYNRVRNLVDHGELENGKFIQYAGIETPIHLIVTKINDDKSEKNIFDDISQTKKWGSGGTTFHKIIFGYNQDNKKILLFPGIYRVKAIAEKDSPELVGTDIYLFMQESFYGK